MAKHTKRDIVIDVLNLVGVPMGPQMVACVARATFGEAVPSTQSGLVSLIEADKKRYKKGRDESSLLVPLLCDYDHEFTAHYAYAALSSWPLEWRLVDYHSPRLFLTRCFLRLLDLWSSGQYPTWNAQPWANPVKKAWMGDAKAYDLEGAGRARMQQDALAALAALEEKHRDHMNRSLTRANHLPEFERLYGKPFPADDV